MKQIIVIIVLVIIAGLGLQYFSDSIKTKPQPLQLENITTRGEIIEENAETLESVLQEIQNNLPSDIVETIEKDMEATLTDLENMEDIENPELDADIDVIIDAEQEMTDPTS